MMISGGSTSYESEKAQPQGIFLHTGWRSAGTWVWSRFRALESVTAFYEPLSPVLSELSVADLPVLRPTLTSGHPALGAPYYQEYRPFLQAEARGVNGYRKRFGTDRFGRTPDSEFPAMRAYLQSLCDQAIDQRKMPVFKFCRSQGRLPWLRHAFPHALHAFVLRNPASQFASGWLLRQQWANPFFVAAPFRVLGLNQTDPAVRQVIELCGVALPPAAAASAASAASAEEYAAVCEHYARTVEGGHAYRAFVALWILCALRLADGADLMIDMDRLGQNPEYAAGLRARFLTRTDVVPDLSGARDLVEETKRAATRMSGVDGRAMRPVHSAAFSFMKSQSGSSGAQADAVELIRGKLALAGELAEQWR